ncbi:MAG: glucose-6-phosphate dehydrogenase assembly protein OpcA [Actinomycetota bacterium]|nr:glucose-6-phosphate dehydrogenase assembly protein OpcA [Actinomycetota bacterium]
MEEALTTLAEIERKLAHLRDDAGLRTSVLTHMAWVPPEWEHAALDTLAGLAERHPSRTILLLPEPDAEDGLDAHVSLHPFTMPGLELNVCSEIIELRLRGNRTVAPASIVAPLLIADLPAFLRWRGRPPFGEEPFEQLIEVADRLIVDSTEWPDLPGSYAALAGVFDRVAVSDIAWARTSRWRAQLASLWPAIADVRSVHVHGTAAQAHLLVGWLRSRLRREIELEHTQADRLEGVDVDGEPAPFPPGDPPAPSDLLSDELDRYGRDPVYEAAVRAA